MRITVGDRQRSFIGAWVLAALLVLGMNGLNLTNLLDQPLLGNSQEVKGIRRQWRLLDQLSSLAIKEAKAFADVDLDRVFSRFEPIAVLNMWHSEATEDERVPEETGPILPILTGIMGVSDPEGNVRFLAVIEGRQCREKEEVQGYAIQRISEEGVYLTRFGMNWFLPAPEGKFTFVRKDLP